MSKETLPFDAREALVRLGGDLRTARLRRGMGSRDLALRVGVARNTLAAMERGDPGVAVGTYVAALWALGLIATLRGVARPDEDIVGRALDARRARRRARGGASEAGGDDF